MYYANKFREAAEKADKASDKAETSARLIEDIVNGPVDTHVTTANGQVPTVATTIKDIKEAIVSGSTAPDTERVVLTESQTQVAFQTLNTSGISVYVDEGNGSYRYFNFTVDGTNSIDLGDTFSAGTVVWGVTQEIGGDVGTAVQQTQANAQLAENWATLTGQTVDGTEYSAKHYSEKAANAVLEHEEKADPHPQYATDTKVDQLDQETNHRIDALVFDSVQDMKVASFLELGQKVRTLGYYEPGDGGSNDYEIVADGTGASFGFLFEQLDNGLEAKLLGGGVMEDKTAYIPTDYGTLQAAVNDLSKLWPVQGVTITLMIEAGHRLAGGVSFVNGDYSHFTINSEDAVVFVSDSFPPTANLLLVGNADGPRVSVFFDMLDLGTHGFVVTRRSTLEIDAGAGLQNAGRSGIFILTGSSISATGAISRYCNGRNIECTAASIASIQNADLRGGNKSGIYIGANYARRGSLVNAQGSDFSDTSDDGASANRGSTFNAMGGIFNNVDRCGFAQSGGTVTLDGAIIDSCGSVGTAEYGGQMTLNNLVATNISGIQAVRTRSGGRAYGLNVSISGLAGSVVNGSIALSASGASEIHVTEATLSHFDRPLVASGSSVIRCPASDLSTGNERASSVFSGGQLYVHLTTTPNSVVAGDPSTTDFNVANFNVIDTNGAVFG